jgi:hypothetical protein
MNNKYKVVILLCPSEPKIINDKYSYYDLEKDKKEESQIYLGGDIRMQAVVQIAPKVDWFIAVGGSKSKVDGMKNYLLQEFKRRKIKDRFPKIIRIESNPDTLGNMMAISKSRLRVSENFAILTNFYHMPRALKISRLIFPKINFNPLIAESILIDQQSTFSLFPKEFIFRVSREINGLIDLENGTYKDLDKIEDINKWKYICNDEELLDELKNLIDRVQKGERA